MPDFYTLAIIILFVLAVSDLIVGVSNDAVNFLNSSIGSKVASRKVIMVFASLGIFAGVTFSSGMMEVARSGVFDPGFFTFEQVIAIFLAVMLTDIILLDVFNTFGMPTSTTVSIVFELLGAAVMVATISVISNGESLLSLGNYINTTKAVALSQSEIDELVNLGLSFSDQFADIQSAKLPHASEPSLRVKKHQFLDLTDELIDGNISAIQHGVTPTKRAVVLFSIYFKLRDLVGISHRLAKLANETVVDASERKPEAPKTVNTV